MATYIDNIVKFHTFSKSPVHGALGLGAAVNPSGHTVVTSQVRTDDIPWFIDTFQSTEDTARTWLATNAPNPKHNDIAYYGAKFKAGFDKPKCLIYKTKGVETPGWQAFDLTKVTTLYNENDKAVIALHKDCTVAFVDVGNNASTNSNRYSIFVKRADGSILDHFVAATDKIYGGMPSSGYNALVLVNGAAIDEGELNDNYIGNTFAGIIHFNKQRAENEDTSGKIKVTCYEYIGDKLDAAIEDIKSDVEDIIGTTMQGVVAEVKVAESASTVGIGVDSTLKTKPEITFEAGTVGGSSDAKLVTGSTVKTYVDDQISTVSAEVAKKANASDLTALTNRVGTAETNIGTLEDKVEALESGKLTYMVVDSIDVTNKTYKETSSAAPKACVEYTIYLVPETTETATAGEYVEWLCCKKGETLTLEQIGTTAADLSGYATDAELSGVSGRVTALETTVGDSTKGLVKSVNANTSAISTLNGTGAGSVSKTVSDAVSSAKTTLQANIDKKADKTTVDALDTQVTANTTAIGAPAGTGTTATGLYKAIEDAKTAAINGAKVTLTAGNGIDLGANDGQAATAFTISAKSADTNTAGVTKISGSGAITAGATGNAAATVAAVGATRSAIESKTIPATATGTSSDNHVKVTLGGTVGAPTVSVTTSDIASASALSTLTTTVGNASSGLVQKVNANTSDISGLQTKTALPDTYATVQSYVEAKVKAAQDATTLTAGTNVAIDNKVISVATDDTYSPSSDAPISGVGVSKAIESINKAETKSNGITYSQSNGVVTITAAAAGTGFGTVKLSDAIDGTANAASGQTAATPKAVSDALAAAKTYADQAEADAIKAAATDATTKANKALADAKTYADQAEADAISAAATDATTKADAAQAAAKTYTDTAIAGITGTTGSLTTHTGNTDIHVTTDDKSSWNTAATKAGTAIQSVTGDEGNTYVDVKASKSGTTVTLTVNETKLSTELGKKATASDLTTHTGNGDIHVTAAQKTSWDGAVEKANAAATQTDLDALDTRVETAEGEIDTLQGDMTTAKSNISTLQGDMTTAKSNISTLQGDMTTAKSNISTLQGDLDTAEGKITTLEGKMTTAESDIDTLQNTVKSLTTSSLSYKVVTALPIGDALVENTIYLIDEDGVSGTYVEYLCYKNADGVKTTEKIGTTATDLSEYAKIKTAADVASTGSTLVGVKVNSGVADAVKSVTVDTTGLTNELKNYTKTSAFSTSDTSGGGITIKQSGGNVTGVSVAAGAVAEGNGSVVTGGTVYAVTNALDTRVKTAESDITALEGLVGSTAVSTQISDAINALDATVKDNNTTPAITITEANGKLTGVTLAIGSGTQQGGNGVTLTQATNGKVTFGVTAGTVSSTSDSFVTGSAVHTAIENAKTAAGTAAQDKINALDVTGSTAANNKGLAWSQTDGKVSIGLTTATVSDAGAVTNGGYLTTASDAQKIAKAAVDALDATVDSTGVTGIKLTQTDGKVASIAVTAGAVASGGTAAVTAGGVKTYVDAAAAKATTKVANSDTEATALGYCRVSSSTGSNGSTTYTVDNDPRITVTKTQLGSPSAVEGDVITGGSVKFVDWSKVEVASSAFANNTNLTAFHADLDRLTTGTSMFSGCTKLTSFCGNLSSLAAAGAANMFKGCALDEESVIYIIDSLPTVTGGAITIGVGTSVTADMKTAYAAEALAKGWTVSWQ